jgi:hypothetical protein
MKTLRRTLLTLMFGALVVLAAPGQTQKKATDDQALPRYDPAQEVKVKGEVLEVKDYECPVSGGMGAHLVLHTSEGPLEVHLALASFLTDFQITFAKGDKVEILGNKITFHDMPAMLVRKVIKNDVEYAFRDAKGNPLWTPRKPPKGKS